MCPKGLYCTWREGRRAYGFVDLELNSLSTLERRRIKPARIILNTRRLTKSATSGYKCRLPKAAMAARSPKESKTSWMHCVSASAFNASVTAVAAATMKFRAFSSWRCSEGRAIGGPDGCVWGTCDGCSPVASQEIERAALEPETGVQLGKSGEVRSTEGGFTVMWSSVWSAASVIRALPAAEAPWTDVGWCGLL